MQSFFTKEFQMPDEYAVGGASAEMLAAIDEGIRAADRREFTRAKEVRDMFAEWDVIISE